MFVKALMVRFDGDLQLMWLQKFHLDVKVLHLGSKVVVLIELWSPPLIVQYTHCPRLVSQFGCYSLEWSVLSEFLGCMKVVSTPFLMIKVAGTVFVFSLTIIQWVRTIRNLLLLVFSLCVPIEVQLESCPSSLKCCDVSTLPFARRNAANGILGLVLHAWSKCFTVWTALSASPFTLWW